MKEDSIRCHSSTAQLTYSRFLLSLATFFHVSLGSIDLSRAYLESGKLERDIYMRPLRGWMAHTDEVWKLLKPAYVLVERGLYGSFLLKNGWPTTDFQQSQ